MLSISEISEIFDERMAGFRHYGVRAENGERTLGEILPNSWHPAFACEWLDEDTELDGSCAFEVQGAGAASAIRMALMYWPDATGFSLIGSDDLGDAEPAGGLPEEGAILLRKPSVLAFMKM